MLSLSFRPVGGGGGGNKRAPPPPLEKVPAHQSPPPPIAPDPAQDGAVSPRRTKFRPSDLGDGLPRGLHQVERRNAEVLGVPIEDAHLQRRDHRSRIRPSLVKHCPRD